jgi:hypothetical protein
MHRLLLAAALGSALALHASSPVAAGPTALDFDDPVVPPQFLLHQSPPTPTILANSGARLLAQGQGSPAPRAIQTPTEPEDESPADSAGLSWLHEGAPGRVLRVIPGSQWGGSDGCALWNWNSC